MKADRYSTNCSKLFWAYVKHVSRSHSFLDISRLTLLVEKIWHHRGKNKNLLAFSFGIVVNFSAKFGTIDVSITRVLNYLVDINEIKIAIRWDKGELL